MFSYSFTSSPEYSSFVNVSYMAVSNGTGWTGKTFNDRELAAKVRTLTLQEIEKILTNPKMNELKKAVILKLSGSILPRLTELSGENGEPIKANILVTYEG